MKKATELNLKIGDIVQDENDLDNKNTYMRVKQIEPHIHLTCHESFQYNDIDSDANKTSGLDEQFDEIPVADNRLIAKL